MQKQIENFELRIGDIAMAIVSKNKKKCIEIALLENPTLRCVLSYDTLQLVSGNIPRERLPYIIDKAKKNKKYLEV